MSNTNTVFESNYIYDAKRENVQRINTEISRLIVPEHDSLWINSLKNRFDELTALPVGWDGYLGQPVSFNNAQFAANLIQRLFIQDVPPPQIVPGSDGSLQIEWHLNKIDIEIDILKPFNVIASFYNHETGEEDEVKLETDFKKLIDWLLILKNNSTQENSFTGSSIV